MDKIDSDERVQRSSLSDQVATVIRDHVLTGRLPAGERVLQAEWANRLGVSRMPVRDAIKRLCTDGILIPTGVGSATVADIDPEDIRDAYHLNAVALSLAARRAAERASDEEILELKRVHVRLQDAIDGADKDLAQRLNVEFHRVVGKLAHSPQLLAVLRLLSTSVSRSSFDLIPNWPEHAVHDHDHILSAILDRNTEAAGKLMLDHITEGYTPMVSRMKSGRTVPVLLGRPPPPHTEGPSGYH